MPKDTICVRTCKGNPKVEIAAGGVCNADKFFNSSTTYCNVSPLSNLNIQNKSSNENNKNDHVIFLRAKKDLKFFNLNMVSQLVGTQVKMGKKSGKDYGEGRGIFSSCCIKKDMEEVCSRLGYVGVIQCDIADKYLLSSENKYNEKKEKLLPEPLQVKGNDIPVARKFADELVINAIQRRIAYPIYSDSNLRITGAMFPEFNIHLNKNNSEGSIMADIFDLVVVDYKEKKGKFFSQVKLGIVSFKKQIRSMVSSKRKRTQNENNNENDFDAETEKPIDVDDYTNLMTKEEALIHYQSDLPTDSKIQEKLGFLINLLKNLYTKNSGITAAIWYAWELNKLCNRIDEEDYYKRYLGLNFYNYVIISGNINRKWIDQDVHKNGNDYYVGIDIYFRELKVLIPVFFREEGDYVFGDYYALPYLDCNYTTHINHLEKFTNLMLSRQKISHNGKNIPNSDVYAIKPIGIPKDTKRKSRKRRKIQQGSRKIKIKIKINPKNIKK